MEITKKKKNKLNEYNVNIDFFQLFQNTECYSNKKKKKYIQLHYLFEINCDCFY